MPSSFAIQKRDSKGRICKGNTPLFTPEHRRNISQSKIGHSVDSSVREKIRQKLLGRKLPEEHRIKTVHHLSKYFLNQSREKNHAWKGGRHISKKGYVEVLHHDNGYRFEHRVVMEKYIGRSLEKDEVVHHINHERTDNRIENLSIMSKKEHDFLHAQERGMYAIT